MGNSKILAKLLCSVGGLDSDTTPYLFKDKNYLNLINGKVNTTDSGNEGAVQYLLSSQVIAAVQTILATFTGEFTAIGAVEDVNRTHIYLFEYNSLGNHLVIDVNCTTSPYSATILLNNANFLQSGINKGLNFSLANLVTGFGILGTTLFWTDNLNDPRRYDTSTLVPGSSFLDSYITIIRRPPGYAPLWTKTINGAISNNLIAGSNFQFCFGYVSLLNEPSVNGPYSLLANYNLSGDNSNTIQVYMPLLEQIPADVQQVVLFVRTKLIDQVDGPFNTIRVWDKTIAADLIAINQHNGATQALTYNFTNNQVGIAQDELFTLKPYDNVPLIAKGLEVTSNRPFVADYTEGYNTPTATSLTITLLADPGTSVTGSWQIFVFKSSCNGYAPETHVMLNISNLTQPGYYYNPAETYPPYPTNEVFTNLVFIGAGLFDVMNFFRPSCTNEIVSFGQPVPPANQYATITGGSPANVNGRLELKSNSGYQVGIVFYDQYLRTPGVFTQAALQINTPALTFGSSSFMQYISWALSNTSALSEIPIWGVYYSIVRTPNLSYNSFAQGVAVSVQYTSKNQDGTYQLYQTLYQTAYSLYTVAVVNVTIPPADGNTYSTNGSTFEVLGVALTFDPTTSKWSGNLYLYLTVGTNAPLVSGGTLTRTSGSGDSSIVFSGSAGPGLISGVAVDISSINAFGMGYVFQAGDVLNLMRSDGQNFTMAVQGQLGSFVLLALANVGNLTVGSVLNYTFELQTPMLKSINQLYYEVGNMYPVSLPGTAARTYSVLNGLLRGDITLRNRTASYTGGILNYVTENMSPVDLYWQYWNTDIGRIQAVVPQPGQIIDPVGIRYGNLLLQGTSINGSCTFDVLNQVDVPVEVGDIQKLQVASQVQEEGTLMLAIGLRNVVAIYIGVILAYQPAGEATQSTTNNVIGQMNILLGGWGTAHPESVIEERGRIWWYCIYKGVYCRYGQDGVVAVSDEGLKTFFAQRSRMLLALMAQGQTVRVFSFYDRFNDEVGVMLPQASDQPNEILADVVPNSYNFNF